MANAQPDGYLAVPAAGNGRPVLVLHAWWGLNDTIRTLCDRLAGAGFVAFAPDLFHGQVTDTIPGAQALARAHDESQGSADVAGAIAFLDERTGHDERGIAVIGFSFGAYYALDVSTSNPDRIRSVVVFYGTGPEEFSGSRAAYLGHFAAQDEFEPQSAVDQLEAALKAAGRPVTIHQYAGTGHWFFEPDRVQAYDAEAANLAWERTLAFLR